MCLYEEPPSLSYRGSLPYRAITVKRLPAIMHMYQLVFILEASLCHCIFL